MTGQVKGYPWKKNEDEREENNQGIKLRKGEVKRK